MIRSSAIGRVRFSVLEMAERRPILGTGTPPAELQALRACRSIFIVGEDTERPRIEVHPVEGDAVPDGPGGWRIEITLNESQQIDVPPRARLHRDPPGFYRGGVDTTVGYEGSRPDWMDMSRVPDSSGSISVAKRRPTR